MITGRIFFRKMGDHNGKPLMIIFGVLGGEELNNVPGEALVEALGQTSMVDVGQEPKILNVSLTTLGPFSDISDLSRGQMIEGLAREAIWRV